MFRIAALLLLAVALPGWGAPLPKDPPKDGKKDAVTTHLEKLAGTWKVEREVRRGRERKEFKRELYLRFKGDTITSWEAGDEDQAKTGKFAIDPTKEPAEMDFTTADSTAPSIYELKGDTLTIASPYKPGHPRPTKFESTPENRVAVMTLKRVKQ